MKNLLPLLFLGIISLLLPPQSFAQDSDRAKLLFQEAIEHFEKGGYKQAVQIFDEILEIAPGNISTLKIKGIALSNLGQSENNPSYHEKSLKLFYTVLQESPDDVLALKGMGLGFGHLGEYQEAKKYFDRALELDSDDVVITNYKEFVDRVIEKYPYTPTEKPVNLNSKSTIIPVWIKNNAKWWSEGGINDSDFVTGIQYLIESGIMEIDPPQASNLSTQSIPSWVRNNAGWWASGQISDEDFLSGIYFMIQNGIMVIHVEKTLADLKKEQEQSLLLFERYLNRISNNVANEKRYIEFPNPSFDVIKKFLRDYIKWNFEQEAKLAAGSFPDPALEIVNGTYVIHYKIFVNQQPSGLPLDHVGTLNDSLLFWQNQEFSVRENPGRIQFSYTTLKPEANVWITWVVRDLGEGVLGHAHVGKGIVEVALGDYSCDGSFQLYDVASVETIMTHEVGHSIGLEHVNNTSSIMYPSFKPKYAYCLLG